jgi:hypothetical protein
MTYIEEPHHVTRQVWRAGGRFAWEPAAQPSCSSAGRLRYEQAEVVQVDATAVERQVLTATTVPASVTAWG